jgi:hypothetical protein
MSQADVTALREQYSRSCAREPWGEAAAVAVLLGFGPVAGDDRFCRHAGTDYVDFTAVLAERTWSTAERFLIATAAALWTGRRTDADMSRVAFLDDRFFGTWQAMITAARTGRVPPAEGGGS